MYENRYQIFRRKTEEYHRIKNKDPLVDKYYRVGIPCKYWEDLSFRFKKIHIVDVDSSGTEHTYFKKTPNMQKKTYTEFLKEETLNENLLVTITSDDSDDAALAAGANIAKKALFYKKKVLFWNSANFIPYNYYNEHSETIPDLIVVYNVTNESTSARFQKIRDLLYIFNDSLKVICASGCNPITFCEEKLKMSPDSVFYMDNTIYNITKSY